MDSLVDKEIVEQIDRLLVDYLHTHVVTQINIYRIWIVQQIKSRWIDRQIASRLSTYTGSYLDKYIQNMDSLVDKEIDGQIDRLLVDYLHTHLVTQINIYTICIVQQIKSRWIDRQIASRLSTYTGSQINIYKTYRIWIVQQIKKQMSRYIDYQQIIYIHRQLLR